MSPIPSIQNSIAAEPIPAAVDELLIMRKEEAIHKPNVQILESSSRLGQLDSIRGLAALTVISAHVMNFFPILRNPGWQAENWIWFYPPFSFFSSGDKAVNMFFVLSGFVLALPFFKSSVHPLKFIVRRVFRIYPVFWVIITLAILAKYFIGYISIDGMTDWFNTVWSTSLSPMFISEHYSLIGSFPNDRLVPVIWSLVHEMRISLIFPLIMLLVLNVRYYWAVLTGFAFILFGYGMTYFFPSVDYFYTFIYIQFFIIGALIARNRNACSTWWCSLSKIKKWGLLLLAVLLYLFTYEKYPLPHLPFSSMINKVVNLAGCGILIIIATGSGKITGLLTRKPFLYVGRLSYGIYLIHTVVFIALTRLLLHTVPMGYIMVLGIILTFLLADFLYQYIELPFIRLGKKLTS